MDIVLRLAWALPLVLAFGAIAVLLLKRLLVFTPSATASRQQRVSLRESLDVSADTRVHLLEIDAKPHVIIESSRHTQLHAVFDVSRAPPLSPWLRRFGRAQQR